MLLPDCLLMTVYDAFLGLSPRYFTTSETSCLLRLHCTAIHAFCSYQTPDKMHTIIIVV